MQNKAVSLRSEDIASSVAESEIEPAVMARDYTVCAVQPVWGFFGGPTQAGKKVSPFIGDAAALRVAEHGQKWGVHDKYAAVVIRQALDGIENRQPRRWFCPRSH